MTYRLGIDIGGTNIRAGKVDDEGNIVNLQVSQSFGTTGEKDFASVIFDLLDNFDLSDVRGIGVGCAGIVDPINKVLGGADNILYTENFPLGKILEERYHLPVELENDANVAGLAESYYGSGKDCNMVYYITHSTGIGAAFILNKKIIRGRGGYAGEVGAFVVKQEPKTRIENADAGPAIYKKAINAGLNVSNTKDVFDEFEKGNEIAISIIDNMCKDFAMMLANIVFTISPDCFIIGGGVSNSFDLYYPILKKYFDYYTFDELRNIPILKSKLSEPGVIGAACLIK